MQISKTKMFFIESQPEDVFDNYGLNVLASMFLQKSSYK